MSTVVEFLSAYEQIKVGHQTALRAIEKALSLEEQQQHEEAATSSETVAAYEHALQCIEAVFAIPVGLPDSIDAVEPEWHDACNIIKRLKAAKMEVSHRLRVLDVERGGATSTPAPLLDNGACEAREAANGYDDDEPAQKKKSLLLENPRTYVDSSERSAKSYKRIINELRELIGTPQPQDAVLFDTLFEARAKLYKIQADGVVVTVAGETSMSLVLCTVTGKWQHLNGMCFIQCSPTEEAMSAAAAACTDSAGSQPAPIWIYALLPAVTNCYRTEYGAFILPDIESDVTGNAFGIMIIDPVRDASPLSADGEEETELTDLQQFFLDLLEAVLSGSVETLEPSPPSETAARSARDTSQVVSRHIVTAADFIAHNLVRGAEKTGELMVKGTPYILSKMKAASPDAAPVSSTVQTSVEVAKGVTNVAVGVTGWVAGKVGAASMALGRYLAPHIQSQGAVLLQKSLGYDVNEANSKMEGALTIAAGAVEGFTTVYNGLESSAKILGNSLSDNSVKIIEHKYGPSAGTVAADTFDTIGNAFNISQNVNYITPKGLAKKMAKNTGKAVVDDYKRSLRASDSNCVPAAALHPDLRTCLKEQSTALDKI